MIRFLHHAVFILSAAPLSRDYLISPPGGTRKANSASSTLSSCLLIGRVQKLNHAAIQYVQFSGKVG